MPQLRFLPCLVLLTLAFSWLGSPVAGSAAEERMTVHDLAGLKSVEEIAFSADGRTLAFVVEVPRRPLVDEDGAAWTELHVSDLEGRTRPFIAGQVEVEDIAWRPESEEITFLAKRGEDEETALYAIDRRGGEAHRLLAMHDGIDSFSWSPDGKRVAVIVEQAKPEKRKKLEEQGFDQKIFEEDWRPKEVWIAEVDGQAEPVRIEVEGSVREVVWSPAGGKLALKVTPTPSVDDNLINKRVRIYDLETRSITRIDNPGKLGDMAWSPNGEHLAYISAADPADPAEGRLMVVAAGGGEPRDLVPGLLGHIENFVWESDEQLLFLAQEGVEVRLGRIDLQGTDQQTLIPLGGAIWTALSRAPTGDVALIASAPNHPDEIYYLAAGTGSARRLTYLNPQLEDVRLAPQEVVRYKARDGLEIEGLLIRPLDEKEGQRYPLVLIVHGGPEAHFSNGWLNSYSRPGQPLAARGFAVFYPNYRASTGRGVEFSKLDHGDPAGKEFDDLVDGVDHLIEIGLVDRDRVGITGGSYGGYASAWGATYYSERFAAAVMSVGISDKISKFGTSDIPHELYQVHDLKWPWDDWDLARQRSPIYHVQKSQTPILILHGEEDTRVHPSQSLILHRYLKVLGKTVRLVLYPGEGHGNKRAASRLDYSLRLMRWMEHYLKGPGGAPPPWELEYQSAEK